MQRRRGTFKLDVNTIIGRNEDGFRIDPLPRRSHARSADDIAMHERSQSDLQRQRASESLSKPTIFVRFSMHQRFVSDGRSHEKRPTGVPGIARAASLRSFIDIQFV